MKQFESLSGPKTEQFGCGRFVLRQAMVGGQVENQLYHRPGTRRFHHRYEPSKTPFSYVVHPRLIHQSSQDGDVRSLFLTTTDRSMDGAEWTKSNMHEHISRFFSESFSEHPNTSLNIGIIRSKWHTYIYMCYTGGKNLEYSSMDILPTSSGVLVLVYWHCRGLCTAQSFIYIDRPIRLKNWKNWPQTMKQIPSHGTPSKLWNVCIDVCTLLRLLPV